MYPCHYREVTTSESNINRLINQLLKYPILNHHQKFMLGINLGICISNYLVNEAKDLNKFDVLFSWIIKNKVNVSTLTLQNLTNLKNYLEFPSDDTSQYDEKLIDLAIYRLHNLLAVSTVIKLNMSLCLKLQTELNELIQLIKKKKNEYCHDTSNINYIHLSKLLEKNNQNQSFISFVTVYDKITHAIQTHLVNDKIIKEWENNLLQLHENLNGITHHYLRDFCVLSSPFCIQERKQRLSEFFHLLKEKVETFIAMCQNDCLPVNQYPFCI